MFRRCLRGCGTRRAFSWTCAADTAVKAAAQKAAAADDAGIAELSCIELEEEITTLKAQASAVGLELEASTDAGEAGEAPATTPAATNVTMLPCPYASVCVCVCVCVCGARVLGAGKRERGWVCPSKKKKNEGQAGAGRTLCLA